MSLEVSLVFYVTLPLDQREVWVGLLDCILCEWQLLRHYFEWVWVGFGWVGGVGVYGALLWVSWCENIFCRWEWVGMSEDRLLFDNAQNWVWQAHPNTLNHICWMLRILRKYSKFFNSTFDGRRYIMLSHSLKVKRLAITHFGEISVIASR